MPKSGHIKNSETWSQLNKEAMKTKEEWDKETKKWSTFLQKPDRPIPRPKVEKVISSGYTVKIVKQPKPRCAPDRTPSPPPIPEPVVVEDDWPPPFLPEPTSVAVETAPVEESAAAEPDEGAHDDMNDTASSRPETSMSIRSEEVSAAMETDEEQNIELACEPNVPKTDEEIYLEKQLADVQQQLMALSNLPLTIQAALDEVTRKLSSIVPAISQVKDRKNSRELVAVPTVEEEQQTQENCNEEVVESVKSMTVENVESETEVKEEIVEEERQPTPEDEPEPQPMLTSADPDWEYKKQEVSRRDPRLGIKKNFWFFFFFPPI